MAKAWWWQTQALAARIGRQKDGLVFEGESFPALKRKEEKAFGEYRTRRLVPEAWERQEHTERGGSAGDAGTRRRPDITGPIAYQVGVSALEHATIRPTSHHRG